MAADLARKIATLDEFLARPEEVRAELIFGEIVLMHETTSDHAKAQGAVRSLVGRPFDEDDGYGGPGGWWILLEQRVHLPIGHVVRPDLAGWRRERLPNPRGARVIDLVPDWLCEVVSPAPKNRAHDVISKREWYARSGVPYYWLIDPVDRTSTALALREGYWLELGVYDDRATVRVAPFEAVELSVGRSFFPRAPEGDEPNGE